MTGETTSGGSCAGDEWLNDFGWSDSNDRTGTPPSLFVLKSVSGSSLNRQSVDWQTGNNDTSRPGRDMTTTAAAAAAVKITSPEQDDLIETYLNEMAPRIDPAKRTEPQSIAENNRKNVNIGKAWDCDEIDLDNI